MRICLIDRPDARDSAHADLAGGVPHDASSGTGGRSWAGRVCPDGTETSIMAQDFSNSQDILIKLLLLYILPLERPTAAARRAGHAGRAMPLESLAVCERGWTSRIEAEGFRHETHLRLGLSCFWRRPPASTAQSRLDFNRVNMMRREVTSGRSDRGGLTADLADRDLARPGDRPSRRPIDRPGSSPARPAGDTPGPRAIVTLVRAGIRHVPVA